MKCSKFAAVIGCSVLLGACNSPGSVPSGDPGAETEASGSASAEPAESGEEDPLDESAWQPLHLVGDLQVRRDGSRIVIDGHCVAPRDWRIRLASTETDEAGILELRAQGAGAGTGAGERRAFSKTVEIDDDFKFLILNGVDGNGAPIARIAEPEPEPEPEESSESSGS